MDTNPGVLLLGTPADRSRVGAAAVVQPINCDERADECAKRFWNEHGILVEVVGVIWQEVPDFPPTACVRRRSRHVLATEA